MNRSRYLTDYDRSTILLIGDSFGILKQVGFALQHAGHTVLWGNSGQAGLRIAECEQPDLIISEIELPDVSGIEVCRITKSSLFSSKIPFVLVGKPGDEKRDIPEVFRAGADDYLVSFTDRRLILAKFEWLAQQRPVFGFDPHTRIEHSPKSSAARTEQVFILGI